MKSRSPCLRVPSSRPPRVGEVLAHTRMGTPLTSASAISNAAPGLVSSANASPRFMASVGQPTYVGLLDVRGDGLGQRQGVVAHDLAGVVTRKGREELDVRRRLGDAFHVRPVRAE